MMILKWEPVIFFHKLVDRKAYISITAILKNRRIKTEEVKEKNKG